jgi:hypothetical protein
MMIRRSFARSGRTAWLEAVCALVLVGAAGVGCGHAGPKAAPDYPPLPAMSGTPVGLLVDEAGRLQLSAAQVSQVQAIDDALHARNQPLEDQARALEQAPAEGEGADAPGGGMRGGGMRGGRGGGPPGGGMDGGPPGGGMGGEMRGGRGGGPPGGGMRGGRGGGGPPAAHHDRAARADRLRAQQRANAEAALVRAFGLLRAEQQAAARALLDERGYDAPPADGSGTAGGVPEADGAPGQ